MYATLRFRPSESRIFFTSSAILFGLSPPALDTTLIFFSEQEEAICFNCFKKVPTYPAFSPLCIF